MRRRLLLLLVYSVGAALFGFILSSIPSPHEQGVFWVGNFSSPWAVLPFLTGWSQRSWVWAACTGVVADVACVMGFYARFLVFDPNRFGLPRSTGRMTVVATSLSHWLAFIAPWVLLAVGAGLLYGMLGAWWGRSRSLIAGLALGLPFIAELWLWALRLGYFQGPLVLGHRGGCRSGPPGMGNHRVAPGADPYGSRLIERAPVPHQMWV